MAIGDCKPARRCCFHSLIVTASPGSAPPREDPCLILVTRMGFKWSPSFVAATPEASPAPSINGDEELRGC